MGGKQLSLRIGKLKVMHTETQCDLLIPPPASWLLKTLTSNCSTLSWNAHSPLAGCNKNLVLVGTGLALADILMR